MSAMHDRLKAPALAKEWFLKIDEGDIFGPVDTASLKEWACDGRVTPGNQISDDRKSWINAEKIPELEMLWMVELGDGSFYGPLNIAALADLIADDAVSSEAKLINQITNEMSDVQAQWEAIHTPPAAAPAPAVDDATDDATDDDVPAPVEAEDVAPAPSAPQPPRELIETIARLESKVEKTQQQLSKARTDAEREHSELELLRKQSTAAEKTLLKKIEELEVERQRLSEPQPKADDEANSPTGQADWTGASRQGVLFDVTPLDEAGRQK
jgi:hypothetical protein